MYDNSANIVYHMKTREEQVHATYTTDNRLAIDSVVGETKEQTDVLLKHCATVLQVRP